MFLICDHCGEKSEREDGVMFIAGNRKWFKCAICRDIDDTETCSSDDIECPYCGFKETDDLYTYDNAEEFVCPACGSISELSVNTEIIYKCSKRRNHVRFV